MCLVSSLHYNFKLKNPVERIDLFYWDLRIVFFPVVMWSTMLPVAALAAVVSGIPCEEARLKCAYREGCGTALKHYLVGCSGVLQNAEYFNHCPQVCFNSLIVLVSTQEGKALMEVSKNV